MSDLPDRFTRLPLKKVAQDFVVPMRDRPKKFEGETPWIRIEDFDGKWVSRSKSNLCVDKETISEMNLKIHPSGTVLCSCSANLGVCAITTAPLITNQTFIGIVPDESRVDKEFLYYLMSSKAEELQKLSSGTTIAYLPRQKFEDFEIDAPPLPEQKKIAEILSGVDRAIMATQNKIEKIASTQEGLANSWQEKVFLEKENGTFGDLIASIDSGWSPACEEVPPESGEWGILKVSAVTKGYFCENESKRLPADLQPREQYLVRKNDLLITRANGNLDLVGRGVIVEEEPSAKLLMSDKILRLKPNKDADRYFLHLLLNSCNIRRQIETAVGGSTGAKNIGQSLLRQICIAIPTPKDQATIGSLSQSLSAANSAAHKRLDYLVSLKNGLSADLLSGRKRVSV